MFIDADLYEEWGRKFSGLSRGCFSMLRKLCSIRRSVPASIYQSLVTALVVSRLDYRNRRTRNASATRLMGIKKASLCRQLQSVRCSIRRWPHHWDTRQPSLAVRVWAHSSWRCWSSDRCMVWLSPHYLVDDRLRVPDMSSRRRLRAALTHRLKLTRPRLATNCSRRPNIPRDVVGSGRRRRLSDCWQAYVPPTTEPFLL